MTVNPSWWRGQQLREDRDGIDGKISDLEAERSGLEIHIGHADPNHPSFAIAASRLDAISDELAALEAQRDEADDEIRDTDPERLDRARVL